MQKDVSLEGNILYLADCLVALQDLPDNSVDSVVCDPPYGLGKQPDLSDLLTHWLNNESMTIKGKGFMNKEWDAFVPQPAIWKECLRVLKPGGHLIAFFGARTYDLGALAIRMAGFEIRDQIMWVYASGFPKSFNIAKAKAKKMKAEGVGAANIEPTDRQWDGYGTALKPAHEPICLARKPLEGATLENVLKHGTGSLNIDACRVEIDRDADASQLRAMNRNKRALDDGWGMSSKTSASVSVVSTNGRWPANLIHDGSDEVRAHFPQASGQLANLGATGRNRLSLGRFGDMSPPLAHQARIESDKNAARFFYCAKPSPSERHEGLENPGVRFPKGSTLRQIESALAGDSRGNHHVSVKPVALMRYLIRLVTPYGGTVLDPFMGSGTTGKAAMLEKAKFIGMELDPGYFEIAKARIAFEVNKPDQEELFDRY